MVLIYFLDCLNLAKDSLPMKRLDGHVRVYAKRKEAAGVQPPWKQFANVLNADSRCCCFSLLFCLFRITHHLLSSYAFCSGFWPATRQSWSAKIALCSALQGESNRLSHYTPYNTIKLLLASMFTLPLDQFRQTNSPKLAHSLQQNANHSGPEFAFHLFKVAKFKTNSAWAVCCTLNFDD